MAEIDARVAIPDKAPESPARSGANLRDRLLAGLPVQERRLPLAGVSTTVLEGGQGPTLILLHGPGGNATHWMRVIADLASTHRVIAPDLPGQGSSELDDGGLDAQRVMSWLDELIAHAGGPRPALVGYALGGAIAARYASEHPGRIERLVLVDALGLAPFTPSPDFGQALHGFLAQPDEDGHDRLWQYCAHDLDRLRAGMGERWEAFKAYNLDRAQAPGVMAALGDLMGAFGMPAIEPQALRRIEVPVRLIWGRHDLATPLNVAQAVSDRHGWPLQVIEHAADDPPIEQPEAFVHALARALDEPDPAAQRSR